MSAVSTETIDTYVIRPMATEDLDPVLAIDRASFSLPWPTSAYRYELFENPNSMLWVAERSNEQESKQVVGMVVVWYVLDEAHIATLAVHPDYRHRGIGQKLLIEALKGSIQHGSKIATLEVRAGNTIAQRLYSRFRFDVVGTRPRYYLDNSEDALIMTAKDLGEDYLHWLEKGAWRYDEV